MRGVSGGRGHAGGRAHRRTRGHPRASVRASTLYLRPLSHHTPMQPIPDLSSVIDGVIATRTRFLDLCAKDEKARADFRALFADDIVEWLRLTGWTFAPKEVDPVSGREVPSIRPHRPFVLWPCQEVAVRDMVSCVNEGRDVVVRKSRDMGASWLVCGVACWGWLFHGWQGLLVSRVEDGVDKSGDPDSLFWKIDYLLQGQPPWLLPSLEKDLLERGSPTRQHMMLRNPVSEATIVGQASTAHVGRGGRRTWIMFDEFAAMDEAVAAWRSAADATACRIAVSTPLGSGTQYSALVRAGRETGDPRLVELLYTDHPMKGFGGETRVDVDGRVTGVVGEEYVWTPWLSEQLKRRDPMDMAQNVFATELGSGTNFFVPSVVTQHRSDWGRVPERCELSRGRFVESGSGRWRVWRHGEPTARYVMFSDPSYGTGAANSAICVMDVQRREVVAEFVDSRCPPSDLAWEMVEAARGEYRGSRWPLIGWEVNGAGAAMHHDFQRIGYTELYRQRIQGTTTERTTVRLGWNSSRRAKRTLLGDLSGALTRGEVVVPSEETLDEMLGYEVTDEGAVESASRADLSSGARESHGDRVIALAGALMLCGESGLPMVSEACLPEESLGALLRHKEVLR